ncbi:MAG: putative lipid II flippase FtsW [Clostridia bacterium]|nr:putative lipid II flippase FtsW [Clostridia bacterium]
MAAEEKVRRRTLSRKKTDLDTPKKERKIVRLQSDVDRPFLLLVILLVCIGTTMVFSASYAYAKQNYDGDSYYFSIRQIVWAVIAFFGMAFVTRIDYLIIKRWTTLFCIVTLALMLIVWVPGIGVVRNNARRWINIGISTFQPSELLKIAVVLFFSDFIARNRKNMHTFRVGVLPFGIVAAVSAGLLIIQPHLSATIIILILIFLMMYLGGTRKKYLGILGILAAVGMAVVIFFSSHGRERLEVWFHPEEYLQGAGWQPQQSLYAIGSGGLWGVGLGQSRQKHLYLPEPQNDYIFSILCEEMGFIFAAFVIVLFVLLIWRGFYIAKNAPTQYASLVVFGLTAHIAVQVFLNLAVVTNSIPSTGVSLPFFSYGGTSLVFCMAEMGIILNISRYSYLPEE